ncbi:MAG: hypothetical protein NVSMB31_10270 [Vulcanimicrobiaceae bacterium]
MKSLNIRFNDEVAELIEHRKGELSDMSVNTLVNVAVRRMLTVESVKSVSADDAAVVSALERVMSRDASILEALKHL